tara:strand:- start:371 stop:1885 length:1515 start_codon:yes stop_codon:yes gene_type:complete
MSILIDVAAEFTGKKAFKQAETATDKLNKSAKSLAKTLGVTLGAAAILGYAKASVKAAADDQKAQKQLALALKNVGLERDAASAEGYIQRLQSEFGIVDDKLRPAYQKLAIATRSTTETQKLLGLSLDISAATGKDLESVTGALSKAYLGSNTALSKLGVGISKADLKTKSFEDITSQLADTFKGAATQSAQTFAGSMAKLGVASQNVKEIIGTGIIDALTSLGNDDSVSNLANDMESVALYVADAVRGMGLLLAEFKSLPAVPSVFNFVKDTSLLTILSELGKAGRIAPKPFSTPMTISGQSQSASSNPQVKATKALTKATQDQLKLAKAKAVFDLQKIQIEAALKGKISEEDRIRLKLMQAIEDENITQIEKYTKLLDAAQAKTKELRDILVGVDPFKDFNASAKTAIANALALNAALQLGQFVPVVPGTGGVMGGSTNAGNYPSSGFPGASVPYTPAGSSNNTVNVTVNAGVGDPEAIARVIEDTLRQANYRGTTAGLIAV